MHVGNLQRPVCCPVNNANRLPGYHDCAFGGLTPLFLPFRRCPLWGGLAAYEKQGVFAVSFHDANAGTCLPRLAALWETPLGETLRKSMS